MWSIRTTYGNSKTGSTLGKLHYEHAATWYDRFCTKLKHYILVIIRAVSS